MSTSERDDDQRLSFTAAVTIAIVEPPRRPRPEFDDDFDGIVDRLDPSVVG